MIEAQGRVLALDGDHAQVRTERRGSCGGCSADGACGTSLLDRYLGRRPVVLRARNRAGAGVGDWVVVGVSEQGLLGAALAAYLVPIVALVVGAAVGQWLGEDGGGAALLIPLPISPPLSQGADLGALVGAILGFLLALIWLRRYSGRLARDPTREPIVLRRQGGDDLSLPLSLPGR